MTQGAFIEYLLDNDCDINEDGNFYRCVVRSDRKLRTMIPKKNSEHVMRPMTMCNICQDLNLTSPPEIEFADNLLKEIKQKIRNSQSEK